MLFVITSVGLGLAAFNLANTLSIGSITGMPPADTGDLVLSIQQLRVELEELRQSMLDMHVANFSRVDSELTRLSAVVDSLFPMPQPSTPSSVETTPPPPNPRPPTSTPQSVTVPIYENCTITIRKSCSVSSFDLLGGNPDRTRFTSCTTTPIALEEEENGHLMNVFCSVSMYQNMPVSSTLSYVGGTWSCVCHALEIPNILQDGILSFSCEMYEQRCPSETRLPLK